MARKVTIAAFEKWIAEESNVALVLERIAGGLTLRNASVSVKQPFTCLHAYFHGTPERQSRYDAARKAWADAQMDEAMEIADGVAPDRDAVAKAKLQVETRANQARAYHRERWGEKLQVEKSVVVVDSNLLSDMGELLRLTSTKTERVIEHEDALTLPAPKEGF